MKKRLVLIAIGLLLAGRAISNAKKEPKAALDTDPSQNLDKSVPVAQALDVIKSQLRSAPNVSADICNQRLADIKVSREGFSFVALGQVRQGSQWQDYSSPFSFRFRDMPYYHLACPRCNAVVLPYSGPSVSFCFNGRVVNGIGIDLGGSQNLDAFIRAANRMIWEYSPEQQRERQTGFETALGNWRTLSVKPPMPDAARVHKVLAENAVEEKNLDKAIDEYEAALDTFPTWPEGQFNLALICGETAYYGCAVEHMQDYLELVPDAPNAQAAKDKLIVWKDKLAQK